MKQLFINISFTTILFAFTLNINYCKKNNTIEPEPENPIKITGTVSNNITEQSNNGNPENTLEAEINDTIHVTAQGTADREGSEPFSRFIPLVFYNDKKISGIEITSGGLDSTGALYFNLNMEGEKQFISNIFVDKKLDIVIEYRMANDPNFQYHKIGEINIKAEHGVIYVGDSAYQTTKDKIDEISHLLGDNPNVVNSNGTHLTYLQFFDGITKLIDGEDRELTDIGLQDDFNRIIFRTNNGSFYYVIPETSNGEKIVFELDKIYGLR